MASIIKRNNNFCVVYSYKDANGTPKQKWETFTDLSNAKNRKKEVEYMLNQANGDRQILAKQLNISPHQLSYVTHSGEGEGLLFFGNVILPFVDHFPKDLELYRILTTRLSEVAEAQKHE